MRKFIILFIVLFSFSQESMAREYLTNLENDNTGLLNEELRRMDSNYFRNKADITTNTVAVAALDGTNVGSEAEVFKERSGTDFVHRTIKAGSGITITENTNDIEISSSKIAFSAYTNADSGAISNQTKLVFITEEIDTGSDYVVADSKFITEEAGTYCFMVNLVVKVTVISGPPSSFKIYLFKNNASVAVSNTFVDHLAVNDEMFFSFQKLLTLAADDYIEVYADTGSATVQILRVGDGSKASRFEGFKVT